MTQLGNFFEAEVIFILVQTIIIFIHYEREKPSNKPVGKWFHRIWLYIYIIACASIIFIKHFELLLIIFLALSLLLVRATLYNQLLNKLRGKEMFYISGDYSTGSGTDRILQKLGKPMYIVLWYFAILLFTSIQVICMIKYQ